MRAWVASITEGGVTDRLNTFTGRKRLAWVCTSASCEPTMRSKRCIGASSGIKRSDFNAIASTTERARRLPIGVAPKETSVQGARRQVRRSERVAAKQAQEDLRRLEEHEPADWPPRRALERIARPHSIGRIGELEPARSKPNAELASLVRSEPMKREERSHGFRVSLMPPSLRQRLVRSAETPSVSGLTVSPSARAARSRLAIRASSSCCSGARFRPAATAVDMRGFLAKRSACLARKSQYKRVTGQFCFGSKAQSPQ